MRTSKSSVCLATAAAFALVAGVGVPAAHAEEAQAPCKIETLPVPGQAADISYVRASDSTGRWMVGEADHDGAIDTIAWHNGKAIELELPYLFAFPGGITRNGTVAGYDGSVGFVSTPPSLIELAMPAGMASLIITGISENGLVSGWASNEESSASRAYVWSVDDPDHPSALRTPPGLANAVGISPDGHIAVLLTTYAGKVRSFVFTKNLRRTELTGTSARFGVAVSSIANGWVAGEEKRQRGESAQSHAVRWNLDTLKPESIPLDFEAVTAVSENGVVGGYQWVGDIFAPVLFGDHGVVLPTLGDGLGAALYVVTRNGDAAGSAATPQSPQVAVRWRCG